MKWLHLCAADLFPIEEGKEGIVTVRTNDPENPVSVYVHDNPECRKAARNHASAVYQAARDKFDEEGNRKP